MQIFRENTKSKKDKKQNQNQKKKKKKSLCKHLYINYVKNIGKETSHMRLTRLISVHV
jgi:hypothetical protein